MCIGTYGLGRSPLEALEGAMGYTSPYTAYYTELPQIDDEQCHTQTHPQLENGPHWLHSPVVYGVYRQLSSEHYTAEQYSNPSINTFNGSCMFGNANRS